MRAEDQELWDLYAILKLLDSVNESGGHADNLKIQKLTFLHELKGQEEGLRSAHFKFFRYNLGPYSKILAEDVKRLEALGCITKTSRQLTKRGRFLLELLGDDAAQSHVAKRAAELIEEIARQHGKKRSPRLVDEVYAMRVPVYDLGGHVESVRNIAMFLDILDPVHMENLTEPALLSQETREIVKEELAIAPENLEPTSHSYRAAVAGALERIQSLA